MPCALRCTILCVFGCAGHTVHGLDDHAMLTPVDCAAHLPMCASASVPATGSWPLYLSETFRLLGRVLSVCVTEHPTDSRQTHSIPCIGFQSVP